MYIIYIIPTLRIQVTQLLEQNFQTLPGELHPKEEKDVLSSFQSNLFQECRWQEDPRKCQTTDPRWLRLDPAKNEFYLLDQKFIKLNWGLVCELFGSLTWKTTATIFVFGLNVIPSVIVNTEMAKTSSTLDAAMIRVGIPLATPNPCSWRARRRGTTTAEKYNL